jgi:nucleoid-associated protein EbfC
VFDRAKTLIELKKIQSALAKEIIDADSGNGAVTVRMNGEMKVKEVRLDPSKYDPSDTARLEKLLLSAFEKAVTRSQQVAAEKMKSVSGGLGLPGL